MTTRSPIQQQIYTRAREGIFRSNEGLDTVAKSAGLDNNFIKKTLHPFCVYNPPRELIERGESDKNKYPDSYTMFHAESGEMVIGRSVFAGADFTGQRDTIFAHNYIVPKSRVDEFIRDPQSIFRISSFVNEYDSSLGKDLPEVEGRMPSEEGSGQGDLKEFLRELGIDQDMFKKLVYAVMSSAASNKKVYISLDKDISELSRYARRLLEWIFHCLPYAYRKVIGFTTYNNEPQGKKGINVMFVEARSIRNNDRQIEKDYVFDLPNNRVMNVELPSIKPNLLDYIWEFSSNGNMSPINAFFTFAEQALSGHDSKVALLPATYFQLYALFQIELTNWDVYADNKDAAVNGINSFLSAGIIGEKGRLLSLFKGIVKQEVARVKQGIATPLSFDYMKNLLKFYANTGRETDDRQFILELLIFSIVGNRHTDKFDEFEQQVYQELADNEKELFQSTIRHILNTYSNLGEEYLVKRFTKIKQIKELTKEITFWSDNYDGILDMLLFEKLCVDKALELLQHDHKLITNGRQLDSEMISLSNRRVAKNITSKIRAEVGSILLGHLSIDSLSIDEYTELEFLIQMDFVSLHKELQPISLQKHIVLKYTATLLADGNKISIEEFTNIDAITRQEVQGLMKKYLVTHVNPKFFDRISLAYFQPVINDYGWSNQRQQVNYIDILKFISSNSNFEMLISFLNWSVHNPWFVDGTITSDYRSAIYRHFNYYFKGELNNRKKWKYVKLATMNRPLLKLLRDIRLEHSNVVIKFFRKRGRMLLWSTLIALTLVILIFGSLLLIDKIFKDKPDLTPDSVVNTKLIPPTENTKSIQPDQEGSNK